MGRVFNGFTSYATGQVKPEEFMHEQRTNVYYLLIISGGAWLFLFLEFSTWLAFGELQAKSARDRLFHGLLEKDIEWYDMRKNGIGAMLPRLQAQIRELQLATSQPLGSLFNLGAQAVLSLIQALVRAWDLTLVTLATVPVIVGAVIWVGRGMQRNLEQQQNKLTEAQKFTTSAFSAIETVKCFNGQEIEHDKYVTKLVEAAASYYRVACANGMQMALVVLLSVSMFVQGFYYGGQLIAEGKRSCADVITTFLSAVAAFNAINSILPQLLVLEKGRTAGSTLRAIMAQVQQGSNFQRIRGLLTLATCRGDIDVKNVTFAYPSRPQQPVLDDVTLFIPAGEVTFLIGKSGSGKSTLGQLLMRFYTSTHGRITLDGVPLESLNVNWLRSNITLVEQTSLLFNDTVFRNIAFGKQNHDKVSRQDVLDVAEFALLQLMINDMSEGLDTVVGYKGGAISGGQRQRMALARARLRNTPILILDESTSALDHISRALMMEAIRQWRRGCTTIIITHDISQISADDYVHVLEHGRIVQEGYRKHMEKMKDTPFQGFLPEDQRAVVSPYDARKATAFESIRTRGSSLDWSVQRSSDLMNDPLETHLDAGESKRVSFLPAVFRDGSPIPAMRARVQGGLTSAFTSPWLRFAISPPSNSPGNQHPTRWSGFWGSKEDKGSPVSKEEIRKSKRWSQIMEKLVDKTGQMAADSRTKVSGTERKRALPQELQSASRFTDKNSTSPSIKEGERDGTGSVSQKSLNQILNTVWPSISWPTRLIVLAGFWGATIHAVASPIFSFVLSKLLHTYAVPGGDQHMALIYSMVILGLAFVDAFHTYAFRFFLEYASQRWVDHIRGEAVKRILDQPRAFFDKEENAVSRMTGNLDRNGEEMRNLLGRFLGLIWIAVLMSSVSLVWAMVAQWKMTLIALAAAPYMLGATKAFAAISEKWEGLSNSAAEDAAAIFAETFTNIKTVRGLTLEDHFQQKYIKATNRALVIGFQRSFLSGFFYGLSDSAGDFSIAMVFYVGAKIVKSGTPVEHVVQVFTMLIFTIINLAAILEYIPQIGSSKDTASRLLRLAELPGDSHEHFGDIRVPTVGEIVFDDLEFSYPTRPHQTILKHINMRILPRTSVAIVGGSGSGKSTIANLLLNLYTTSTDPGDESQRAGDLMLAGRDIKHIDTTSLRSLVTCVSQAPTLFAATVAENIAYGLSPSSPYNTLASIMAAASQAGIHDFINSLPQGYSTLIGEGGIGLSGGQVQRIAIARALVRKPAALILDEATSALDVESADQVRQAIQALVNDDSRAMTVVIITHSRDMMEMAESIFVLDQGHIVEEGPFEEVLGRSGALANLLSGGEWDSTREEKGARPRPGNVPLMKNIDWRRQRRRNPKLQM